MDHLFTTKEADKHFWALLTDVPKAKNAPIAIACALANIIVPGTGCVAISLLGDSRQLAWSMDKTNFVVGIVQFLMLYWYIGYAFGAYWSYLFMKQYMNEENKMMTFVSRYSLDAVHHRQQSLARKQSKTGPKSSPF